MLPDSWIDDYHEDLKNNPAKYRDLPSQEALCRKYGFVWSKDYIGWSEDNCIPSTNRSIYFTQLKEL